MEIDKSGIPMDFDKDGVYKDHNKRIKLVAIKEDGTIGIEINNEKIFLNLDKKIVKIPGLGIKIRTLSTDQTTLPSHQIPEN